MPQLKCMSQVRLMAGDPMEPLFGRGFLDRCMPDKTSLFPPNQRRRAGKQKKRTNTLVNLKDCKCYSKYFYEHDS